MKKSILLSSVLFAVFIALPCHAQSDRAKPADRDRAFIANTAMSSEMELELGEIAARRGANREVKDFGRRMAEDHSKLNLEITRLAKKKGISLSTALDERHRAIVQQLAKYKDAAFDREYMNFAINEHQSDLTNYRNAASMTSDPDISTFVQQATPILQEHLKLAKSVLTGMSGKKPAR